MSTANALICRDCTVVDETGVSKPLTVSFYAPVKNPEGSDYLAHANIACAFFDKDVYGTGEDPAQAFFWLPIVVVSYLVGMRRKGFEAYWLEKGDLDYEDFWTYRK
jgi:hypothetical protein